MNRSVAAFSLARTLRTNGLAEFIAPSRPLGRLASALALTALLAGVQLTLGLANAGSSLCRLAGGGCAFAIPAPRGSASPPAAAPQPAPDRTRPTSTTAATVGGPAPAL
ncbi:MAG: hypothetical protein ACTHOG_02805, partial [Marmoricola sp.]